MVLIGPVERRGPPWRRWGRGGGGAAGGGPRAGGTAGAAMPKLVTGGRAASGGAASGVDNVAELTVSVRLSVATGRAAVSKPSAEATTTAGSASAARDRGGAAPPAADSAARGRYGSTRSPGWFHRPLNPRAGRPTPPCCPGPSERRWTDRRKNTPKRFSRIA